MSQTSFVNPYTFIPVEKCSKKQYDSYFADNELLTGKISCTLTARTQLSVCDNGDNNEKGFCSLDGIHPMIPGSALRGTVRSVYEALTDSCFSVVNAEEDDFFSSRMKKDKTGLLAFENGKYVIYEAKRYKEDDENYEPIFSKDTITGDKVMVATKDCYVTELIDKIEYEHDYEGYFLRVCLMNNKIKGRSFHNFASVFVERRRIGEVDEVYIHRLERNIDMYKEGCKEKNIALNYENAFKKMKRGETKLPVWYCYDNGHYYFAPSQISRSVFYNRPVDLIRKNRADKCSDPGQICDACSLFGIINDKKLIIPSRLRFTDAVSTAEKPFDGPYILPVLSSPRLSSFEFYLKNPKSKYGADDDKTTISGRKFYWHNNKANINCNSKLKSEQMQNKVQLVKSGTSFTFDIFFDRITEAQLKKLLFAINLGENRTASDKCHKIGHGKPIGLGSVKIVVDSVTVRSYKNGEYIERDLTAAASEDNSAQFSNMQAVKNILRVMDFNAIPDGNDIGYPAVTEGDDIFKWFAKNRRNFREKEFGTTEYINKLPLLSSESQSIKRAEQQNNNHRNKW